MSNTYNISVTYEIITDESAEIGDAAERGFERELKKRVDWFVSQRAKRGGKADG